MKEVKTRETLAVEGYLGRREIHDQWEGDYRTPENEAFYEEAFDRLVLQVRAAEGATWLDAGCGPAYHTARLARRGFRVEAVDFSDSILEDAKTNLERWELSARVNLRCADLLDLPYEDAAFHCVLSWGVLMHVPQVGDAVRELARVTAPGGGIVVSEGNMRSLQSIAMRTAKRVVRRSSGQTRTAAGMESWSENEHGKLLTRQADIGWLIDRFDEHGCSLEARVAGQFTETYTIAPRPMRKAIHAWNRFWFRNVRRGGPAFGNLLFLRRRG